MGENGALSIGGASSAGKIRLTLANCLDKHCGYLRLDTVCGNTLIYVQTQAIRYYVSSSRQGFEGAFMVKTQGREQVNAC
jgi:hypothetical protein